MEKGKIKIIPIILLCLLVLSSCSVLGDTEQGLDEFYGLLESTSNPEEEKETNATENVTSIEEETQAKVTETPTATQPPKVEPSDLIDKLLGSWEDDNNINKEMGMRYITIEKLNSNDYVLKDSYVSSEYIPMYFSSEDIKILSDGTIEVNAIEPPSDYTYHKEVKHAFNLDIKDYEKGKIVHGYGAPTSEFTFIQKDTQTTNGILFEKYYSQEAKAGIRNYNDAYDEFLKNKEYNKYITHWDEWESKYAEDLTQYAIVDFENQRTPILVIESDPDKYTFRNTVIFKYNIYTDEVVFVQEIYSYGRVRFNMSMDRLNFKPLNYGSYGSYFVFCDIWDYTSYHDCSISYNTADEESYNNRYLITKYKPHQLYYGPETGGAEIDYNKEIGRDEFYKYYDSIIPNYKDLP